MVGRYNITFGFLPDTVNQATKRNLIEKKKLDKLNLSEIKLVDFPKNQYYRYVTPKNQIVLHHTVSGQGVSGDIRWWLMTSARIATHVIIDWKGNIYQCYSSKYWGHHLGVKNDFIKKRGTSVSNVNLNKNSIGVEIDSWGGLVKERGKWYPAKWDMNKRKFVGNKNAGQINNVQEYPNGFRGFYGFEKYTDEQILSIQKLLRYWHDRYNIPLNYNEKMWDVNNEALNGKSGVWTHVSYRDDKSDCHPQPELIHMLKSL